MRIVAITALAAALATPLPARAQQWVDITPANGPAPSPRRNVAAIYDAPRHRMVVFGGRSAAGNLNDIWAFDLATKQWADITPAAGSAPAPRLTPDAIFDPGTNRMVMWAGQGNSGFFNDTWAFDLVAATWSDLTPAAPLPNIRYGTASVYDPIARDQVTFAGFTNAGRFDDTWRFSLDGAVWTDATPAGTQPLERCLHTASYDAQNHRMIMYGGQNAGARDDIWAFDLTTNTWSDLTPATRPAGRWFSPSIYDALSHRLLVFGGNLGSVKVNEVLAFDLAGESWSVLTVGGTPPSVRDAAAAIHIPSQDRMVVFGGWDTDLRNDVWSLEDLSAKASVPIPGANVLALYPNRPNPAKPTTTLTFDLPQRAGVTLRLFDLQGREVRRLEDGVREAGRWSVTWDGRDEAGRELRSGVYFYALDAGGQTRTRKLVLQR